MSTRRPRPSRQLASAIPPAPATEPARLLHLDDAVAAVAKPAGLSLATPQRDPGAAVARLLGALSAADRTRLTGSEPHLVHRLDVGTSGVVLLARTADAHRGLVAAFGERRVAKTYLALVWGHPRPREGRFDAALGPDHEDRRRMRVDAAGRHAATRYRVVAVAPHVALVELAPETGRTHQIRVHLAHAGHPVVGDDLYGGPRHHGIRDVELRDALAPPHTFLHAWRLTLPAPPLATALAIVAPLPNAFVAALVALGLEIPSASDHP
jgi:23S rRNA pseudouridine1911/1915/1917 synthase